jgi:ATP-binding protein involved in chromosome partitioning
MSEFTQAQIKAALKEVRDQNLDADLVAAGAVKDIDIAKDRVTVHIELGYPANGYREELAQAIRQKLEPIAGKVEVKIDSKIISHAVQQGVKPLAGIKNTIAVASGKGGVGKSTTAVNLALALQAEGANVGILDADIYGPSQPRMLGCRARPDSSDGKTMAPNISYKLQSMSIGYLINEEDPMIWRGPMVTSALEQLLTQTRWSDLDYLVIDLPPGTGDIQLTLCQKIPVSGAVIVTTPQDIALLDAKKGLRMFQEVNVPVLGIVENMSIHICSKCGHEEAIFGSGGGQQMSEQYGVDLLGQLPLDVSIREGADNGRPTVAIAPDSHIASIYRRMARRTAAKLSMRAKDYSARFPKIVIQNN